jgi:hypothetical protein
MTGGGGGSFNVTGTVPTLSANIGNNDWAAGFRDSPNTQVVIEGARTRGGGRYDLAVIGINRLTVGSSNVEADCEPDVDNCSGMIFAVNFSQSDDNFTFICFLETGSLAISEITSSRVKGQFSGTGQCIGPPPTFTTSNFTVSGGTFDVPLVSTLPQ